MGCACKSNTGGIKKQVTQITKRTSAPITHSNNQNTSKRKQIIIKRPSR